jgi:Putative DNA-binding domain
MTLQELRDLVQEIRHGRTEDGVLDWKRKFWVLTQKESLKEFMKDITAMANSTAPDSIRRILLGVASGGVLYDSPLPDDEARVQQHLTNITPLPNVHFESHTLEGKIITVIEIRPPFDKPYVAKVDNEYYIWVRLGSSTGTASRQLLDRFYRAKERVPGIDVNWRVWTSAKPSEDPDGRDVNVLLIPPPKFSLDELRQKLEEERQIARANASAASDPSNYQERLRAYEERCDTFLEKIADPHLLGRWYLWEEVEGFWDHSRAYTRGVCFFSTIITNNGNAPATGVSVRLQFPPWLYIFSEHPKMPDFLKPKLPSLDPPPPASSRLSQLPSWVTLFPRPLLPAAGTRSQEPEPIRIQHFEQSNRLSLEADSLTHTYHFGHSPRFIILALPSMPNSVKRVEVNVSLFWREIDDWEERKLSIEVESTQNTTPDYP